MDAWEEFLTLQDEKLGKETAKKWLRPFQVKRFDARNVHLEAKDSFQALWFEEHVRKDAQAFFVDRWNGKVKIHVQVENVPEKRRRPKPSKPDPLLPSIPQEASFSHDPLDPLCTFKHFVVTEENTLACRIAAELSGYSFETHTLAPETSSWCTYNPLYVFGKQGSGKTHFLMALAQAARECGLHTLYVSGETFIEHVISAIRAGQMSLFRQTYRNADVLLIDDVDVFSGKGGTQEELFHTFNTLQLSGRQIVLAAHCAPNELQKIEPRLMSRFEWGITFSLPVLEEKGRHTLVAEKAKAMGFSLPFKVIDFLCNTFVRGPQAAIRALEALALHSHRLQTKGEELPNTLSGIKLLLADLIHEEEKRSLTAEQIIQAVTEYFGIRKEDITGKAQTKECVFPRQLSMFLCRQLLKMPFMRIGELFGRDHSTVMASVRAIQTKLDHNEKDLSATCRRITRQLQP